MAKAEVRGRRKRAEEVRAILRQQMQLTLKQEKFCNDDCVERFLRAKNDSAKKAAKQLKACLGWRDAIGADRLTADEFPTEIAEGVAYLAGQDNESRPVMIFRIKQEDPNVRSQKLWMRFLVFSVEEAISSMSALADQFILIFDARGFRSASPFLNLLMAALKMISENYPGRLHRAFAVDPPSVFPYLWKAARPFADLWTSTTVISSAGIEEEPEEQPPFSFPAGKSPSLRFDPSPRFCVGSSSSSSRFSFTVSQIDSLKPWYLTSSPSLSARSFSFAAAGARSTPPPPPPPASRFFRRKDQPEGKLSFKPYLRFYRRPYNEIEYRAKIRHPCARNHGRKQSQSHQKCTSRIGKFQETLEERESGLLVLPGVENQGKTEAVREKLVGGERSLEHEHGVPHRLPKQPTMDVPENFHRDPVHENRLVSSELPRQPLHLHHPLPVDRNLQRRILQT